MFEENCPHACGGHEHLLECSDLVVGNALGVVVSCVIQPNTGTPHRVNSHSVATPLETPSICRALAASVDPEHVARAVRGTAHMEAVQLAWTRCRCTRRSLAQCTSTLTGLHVSVGCQRGRARAMGVAADGLGKHDDHFDLGDAMDIVKGRRWTWLGREVERLRRGRKVAHRGFAQAPQAGLSSEGRAAGQG